MQNLLRLNCLGLIFFCSTYVLAQAPNSREPEKKKVFYSPHKTKPLKLHKVKITHTARYEFYKRVEKAARQKQKLLRKLGKPQYSNRAYFGHKRMPKKRIWFKMRYCDECGIRH